MTYIEEANMNFTEALISAQPTSTYRIMEMVMLTELMHNGFAAVNEAKTSKRKSNLISKAKDTGNSIKSFFKKIIQFIKDMVTRFKEKLDIRFKESKKWLEEREKEFQDIDYSSMEMDIVPYWKGDNKEAETAIKQLRRLAGGIKVNFTSSTDSNDFLYRNHLKKYLVDSSDPSTFTAGMKNMLRVGNVKGVNKETIKGDAVKNLITGTVIPYIKTQHDNIVNSVTLVSREATKIIEVVESEINKRETVNESAVGTRLWSIGATLENTAMVLNKDVVLENDRKKDSNVKDSESVDRTTVSLKDKGEPNTAKIQDDTKHMNNSTLQAYKNVAKAAQSISAISATISEERYTFYMNILRTVWSEGNTRGKKQKD